MESPRGERSPYQTSSRGETGGKIAADRGWFCHGSNLKDAMEIGVLSHGKKGSGIGPRMMNLGWFLFYGEGERWELEIFQIIN